jgi:hypothetical protein
MCIRVRNFLSILFYKTIVYKEHDHRKLSLPDAALGSANQVHFNIGITQYRSHSTLRSEAARLCRCVSGL